jgi:hypothetical protein
MPSETGTHQRQLAEAQARIRMMIQHQKGEYWCWQGDGEDHLESLTCPVLIQAGTLREMHARIAALEAENHELRESLAAHGTLRPTMAELGAENERLRGALWSIKRRFSTGVCRLCQSCSIDKQVALQEIDAALSPAPALIDLVALDRAAETSGGIPGE